MRAADRRFQDWRVKLESLSPNPFEGQYLGDLTLALFGAPPRWIMDITAGATQNSWVGVGYSGLFTRSNDAGQCSDLFHRGNCSQLGCESLERRTGEPVKRHSTMRG